jgi:hypothetical protein
MIGGAEQRDYDPHLPSTPGWQLCVMQQSLGRIASMPASGHHGKMLFMESFVM